jgi:hypothetical protein
MVGSEVPLAVSEASEMETEALMDLEVLLAAMEADTVVEEEETGMALVAGMEALASVAAMVAHRSSLERYVHSQPTALGHM